MHEGDQLETSNAVIGTMNHAETWFSKQVLACAIISMFQYLGPLLYSNCDRYRSPWAHGSVLVDILRTM
jgi:hypothetical protein